MNHIELEAERKKHIRKRRRIEGILCAAFLLVIVVFAVLCIQSTTVKEIGWGPILHRSVTYNYNFLWGIGIGVLGLTISLAYVVNDILFTRLETVQVNGDFITVYRGLSRIRLYVNGECKDEIALLGYYLEAPLTDGTKVTVSLGKYSVHLSFSNGHPPLDV